MHFTRLKPVFYLLVPLLAAAVIVVLLKGTHVTERPKQPSALPAQAIAEPALPAEIAALTDSNLSWRKRIQQLHKNLTIQRSEGHIIYLYHILAVPHSHKDAPEDWYVIANEIMIELGRHDHNFPRFNENFLKLIADRAQPPVLRDYAVQHLLCRIHFYLTAPSGTQKPPSALMAASLKTVATLATQPEHQQSTLPGTTLMMLIDLSHFPEGKACCKEAFTIFKPWIAKVFDGSLSVSDPARISTIQAVAAFAPDEFLTQIRSIAYAENGLLALQLPAIAALVGNGEPEDIAKLTSLASTSPALKEAAQKASQSLNARLYPPH